MPYRQRYSCTVSDPRDDVYMAVAFTAIIAVPAVILLVIGISTVLTFHREKKKQKKIKGQSYSYLDQILMIPYYRNELYPSVCMLALSTLCLILWLPYGALTTLDPLLTTHWFNRTFDESHEFQDHYIDSGTSFDGTASENSSLYQDMTEYHNGNVTNHVHYIPEMSDMPVYETVFIWFRFVFDLLIPIVIFITLKDIRQRCESLIFCCRPPSIDVASPKQISPPYLNKAPMSSGFTDIRPRNKSAKNEQKKMVNFTTPVLFATAEGLHIRTVEETLPEADQKHRLGFGSNTNSDPKFSYEVCDIVLPDEDLVDLEGHLDLEEEEAEIERSIRDYEKSESPEHSFEESVIMGANAAFMSRNPEITANVDVQRVNERLQETAEEDQEDKDDQFVETIELEAEKESKSKKKKKVRFDTNLNIAISRPSSAASATSVESLLSINSVDSGVFGRAEQEVVPQSNTKANGGKLKPKKVIHNVRNSVPRAQKKSVPAYNRFNSKPTRRIGKNKISPNETKPNKVSGVPKVNKIKSRYMNHYNKPDTETNLDS